MYLQCQLLTKILALDFIAFIQKIYLLHNMVISTNVVTSINLITTYIYLELRASEQHYPIF